LSEFIGGIANCPMECHEYTISLKQGCTLFFTCLSNPGCADELCRCGIDVLPTGTHALVSQQVGRTHLVAISQDENRGKVKQVYTVQPDLQADAVYDANALFVGRNDAVLYGSANGYLFAWDKANANVLCGLDHGEGACPVAEYKERNLILSRLRRASYRSEYSGVFGTPKMALTMGPFEPRHIEVAVR
jgi:hypothetical protein